LLSVLSIVTVLASSASQLFKAVATISKRDNTFVVTLSKLAGIARRSANPATQKNPPSPAGFCTHANFGAFQLFAGAASISAQARATSELAEVVPCSVA
jgi:hypothetical protein